MESSVPEGGGSAETAQQLICLTLAWDQIPESISMEGGSERILREPVCAILVKTTIGWVLLDTGTDARRFRGPNPDRELYAPAGLPEFLTEGDPLLDALAAHGLAPSDIAVAAVSHLHFDHSGGLRHLAEAGVEVCIQRRELDFAMTAAGRENSRQVYRRAARQACRTIDRSSRQGVRSSSSRRPRSAQRISAEARSTRPS